MKPSRRRPVAKPRFGAMLGVALTSWGGGACLPIDSRPPPGSLLLNVVSDDEPSVTTADGWSISVDRMLLGIGYVSLGYNPRSTSGSRDCTNYSEDSGGDYNRLLDVRLPTVQKVGLTYGLGQCYFGFSISYPSEDSILGEGVTEADKEQMAVIDGRRNGPPPAGIAVDFAATATRASETMRVHWRFRQPTSFMDCRRRTDAGTSPVGLDSNENVTVYVGIRGVELFGDDESATSAELRFDPLAYVDSEFGNNDHDVTLEEMALVDLNRLRSFGPYSVGNVARNVPRTLADYMLGVLLPKIARMRDNIACQTGFRGQGPP